MKISVVKTRVLPDHIGATCLLVVSPHDIDAVNKLADGEMVAATIKRQRNLNHHNLFMAILRMVADNKDNWTVDRLITALKFHLGRTEVAVDFNGIARVVPMSISFEAMDQDAFAEFFDKSLPLLAELLGVSENDLMANCEDYI